MHAEIFGSPGIVGDAHVPAATGPAAVPAAGLGEEGDEDELLVGLTDEGAVGINRLVLNWQPLSSTDAAIVTAQA